MVIITTSLSCTLVAEERQTESKIKRKKERKKRKEKKGERKKSTMNQRTGLLVAVLLFLDAFAKSCSCATVFEFL